MRKIQSPSTTLKKSLSQLKQQDRQRLQMATMWLQEQQFTYAVIGGLAICQYASQARPLTPDLDVLVDDIAEVKEMLDHHNIYNEPLIGQSGKEIGLHLPVFNLDLLDSSSMANPISCKEATDWVQLWKNEIKFIDIHCLLLSKLFCARNHDFVDVQLLIDNPRLKLEILKNIGIQYPKWNEELESIFWQLEERDK